jgi:hypothetical protein
MSTHVHPVDVDVSLTRFSRYSANLRPFIYSIIINLRKIVYNPITLTLSAGGTWVSTSDFGAPTANRAASVTIL